MRQAGRMHEDAPWSQSTNLVAQPNTLEMIAFLAPRAMWKTATLGGTWEEDGGAVLNNADSVMPVTTSAARPSAGKQGTTQAGSPSEIKM